MITLVISVQKTVNRGGKVRNSKMLRGLSGNDCKRSSKMTVGLLLSGREV